MGTASKGAVIPENPTWPCLPSVQIFLGIFIFHLESFLKWTLRKCNTCLGRLVAFAEQMIYQTTVHLETPDMLCCISEISYCCVPWLAVLFLQAEVDSHMQPAQHCVTAQVPGSVA